MEFEKYKSILYKEKTKATSRRKMTQSERACQFAPFAALNGFDEVISEQSRLTDRKIELSEYEIERINDAITYAINNTPPPLVLLVYFVKDKKKSGGRYNSIKCRIKSVDEVFGNIVTDTGISISLGDIVSVEIASSD